MSNRELLQARIQSVGGLLERLYGRGLLGADLASLDVCHIEVLSANGRAGQAAHHRQLTCMGETIGNGALKNGFGCGVERLGGGKIHVEILERFEKSLLFRVPGERCRVMPPLVSLHTTQGPIEQVAHVSEDLDGPASSTVEVRKLLGRALKRASGAVSEAGNRMAEQFAFFVHGGRINHREA